MNSIKKNKLKLVVLLLVLVVVILNFTGFCYREMRYISDEQLIEKMVREHKEHINIDGSEASIRNYHVNNPRCCSVSRGSSDSWLSNLFFTGCGFYTSTVLIEFQQKFKDKSLNQSSTDGYYEAYYEQYDIVNACGDRLRSYGTGTTNLPGWRNANK